MNKDFGTTNNEAAAVISTNALREQALQRLAGVQDRLESKGVGAAFLRVARPDPIGDMGFLSTLLFHAVLCGPLADMVAEHLPSHVMGDFNNIAALGVGGLEGISLLKGTEAKRRSTAQQSPRLAFYPLGRNKDPLKEEKASRKFNKVAANQNGGFSADVQADLACMFDIMDTLGKLEERGAKDIQPGKSPMKSRPRGKIIRKSNGVAL